MSVTNSPLVGIIVLNWNNPIDTIACLNSISALQYRNYTVLVVDNGSDDNSVEEIARNFPDISILPLESNLGYATGNNEGIRHALANGADYILILNNDTLVDPSMLTKLVTTAVGQPNAGMVGPTMFCADSKDTLFATGGSISWSEGRTWNRGMFQSSTQFENMKKPEPVDYIPGCGVLVRRDVIEAIGLLDERYCLNFEDVEWAVRARRFGYQVWYDPYSVMWHKVSSSLGQASPANTYYMTRNALLFFWSNSPIQYKWMSITHIVLRTLYTICAWSLKPKYQTESFNRRRDANLLALRDFFTSRYGKMGSDVAKVCYP